MPPFNRYLDGTTVSRDLPPGEYSWDEVVFQSGKFILDAELNLGQAAAAYDAAARSVRAYPSGFVRRAGTRSAGAEGFSFYAPPLSGSHANRFQMRSAEAYVAGMRVAVEYSSTSTPGYNLITLPAATAASGSPPDVKRTDFVFLEVWRAVVAPSPRATGTVEVAVAHTLADGDTVELDLSGLTPPGPLVVFTARTAPATPDEFAVGGGAVSAAAALAAVINDPANGAASYVSATTSSTNVVTLNALFGGVEGNLIGLAVTVTAPGALVPSGATLTGGATRPNKPSDTTIYRKGNVLAPGAVNLTENLIDPMIGVESTQRVQIQYRLRVYSSSLAGLNPKSNPDGFSHAGVGAQGATGAATNYRFAPADGSTVIVSGGKTSSAAAYGWVDGGLWVAGSGDSTSATDLGTADGFVYAIPVAFVFRRNDANLTGGFNPEENANGALSLSHTGFSNSHLSAAGTIAIAAGKSDRPDGLFHDWIVEGDVLDLRRHVAPAGLDYGAELTRQVQRLLDGENSTWAVDASDMGLMGSGSGGMGVRPLLCNEIGRTGAPDLAGDHIRQFDHVARRLASQSVVERVVFSIPAAGPYPTGITVTKATAAVNWYEGDSISIDFDALNPTTRQDWTVAEAPGTVSANWPAGTRVTDVLRCRHDDGHSITPVAQAVEFSRIEGVGTTQVDFTLDGNDRTVDGGGTVADHPMIGSGGLDTGSARRIFLELEVTYPTGAGLVRTPRADTPSPDTGTGYDPYEGGPVVEPDPTQRPPEMSPTWVPRPQFRAGYREVLLEARNGTAAAPADPITDTLVTESASDLVLPRRLATLVDATVDAAGVSAAEVGSSSGRVSVPVALTGQVAVAVVYRPQDPVPDAGATGYQLNVYYTAAAPQTAGSQTGPIPATLLPETLTVEPLAVLPWVYTGQTGAGSVELSYPYARPLDVIAVPDLGGGAPRDWYFAATAEVSVANFDAPTGMLALPSLVQMDVSGTIQLGDAGRGPDLDPEFRTYYDTANPTGYRPAAMATGLLGAARHKAWVALLVRTETDTRLFRRGELIVMVVSRLAPLDHRNTVAFTDVGGARTVAALYRTQNLLLTSDS